MPVATMFDKSETKLHNWEDFDKVAKFFRESSSDDMPSRHLKALYDQAKKQFESADFDF